MRLVPFMWSWGCERVEVLVVMGALVTGAVEEMGGVEREGWAVQLTRDLTLE